MSKRKRIDANDEVEVAVKHERSENAAMDSPVRSDSALQSSHLSSHCHANFGSYIWNEVSIVLYHRFFCEIRQACLQLLKRVKAKEPGMHSGGQAIPQAVFDEIQRNLQVIWEVGKRHLSSEERHEHDDIVCQGVSRLVSSLQSAMKNTADLAVGFKQLQRFLEDEGFCEDEDGEILNALLSYCQNADSSGYSYHERTSLKLPLLRRYDGDKRAEDEHNKPRSGHVVVLPYPHPHPDVNTRVQLIEPKKKRPLLDESRIFSHPKKASTYGVEDFLVDEELTHRALVVLTQHLDTFGSLTQLSPYVRFLVWNLLNRDCDAFERLCTHAATTGEMRAELHGLREIVAAKQAIFQETRVTAREAAQTIGWYAISAQWRDQILHRLAEVDEADWYCLGDVPRQGGSAIFPNYAGNKVVCQLAMGLLKKMDGLRTGRDAAHETIQQRPACVAEVSEALLLPLLQGKVPQLTPLYSLAGAAGGNRSRQDYQECVMKAFTTWTTRKKSARSISHNKPHDAAARNRLFVFITSTLLFPLQCLAELLDLCSLAYFAKKGPESFTSALLAASWMYEEELIAFLMHSEPTNTAIAPLVALPRLYRDIEVGVQLMFKNELLPYVFEARLCAEDHEAIDLHERNYIYWRGLSDLMEVEKRNCQDTVLLLEVEIASCAPSLKEVKLHRYSTVGRLERPVRVWNEDVQDLIREEERYKQNHYAKYSDPIDNTAFTDNYELAIEKE